MSEQFDKFLAIPTSQKVAVLVMILAALGAGWYFLLFSDLATAVTAEAAQTQKLNKDLAAEQEIEKNLVKYQAEIEELRKQRDAMRDSLPDNAEIADLLQQIHGEAKFVGLEISRFERGPNQLEPMYARIPVRMVLSGTFHQISTFFFRLGTMPRLVNVENITLTVQNTESNQIRKEGEETKLNAECTATTFMYVAPEAAAVEVPKGGH